MQNLFSIISEDFFKPLTGKYKREYSDCIQLLFNTFKPEITYGIDREIAAAVLEDYFEDMPYNMSNDTAVSQLMSNGTKAPQLMTFDEDDIELKDARSKANIIIRELKNCGWLEYEQAENHHITIVLNEYAIPIIESFNKIIKEEETEYQSIISQIHSTLQNTELFKRPYELILKGVKDNTERLISELKRLNASIKRHMDKQTNQMNASEILEHFFTYHKEIGSKAYLRMKTSDNISYFRNSIIDRLENMISDAELLNAAVKGYMEIEQEEDETAAFDQVISIIREITNSFFRLDDIIKEIDKKHAKYQRNAVMRAKFLLSTGNNMEGKLSVILNQIAKELNASETAGLYEEVEDELWNIFQIYPQKFMDNESLKVMPAVKEESIIDEIDDGFVLSAEERKLHQEAIRLKNLRRFSRKNVNQFVENLLKEKDRIKASAIPIHERRDMLRIIYINLYSGNRSNSYYIERGSHKVNINGYGFTDFDIIKAD